MVPYLVLASWKVVGASGTTAGLNEFSGQSDPVWDFVLSHASGFAKWTAQPQTLVLITVWWVTFTIIVTFVLCLGFGPSGVIPGSLAAALQGWAYGAFTPAGGIFATLTSLGMVGFLAPAVALFSAGVATATAFVTWLCQ